MDNKDQIKSAALSPFISILHKPFEKENSWVSPRYAEWLRKKNENRKYDLVKVWSIFSTRGQTFHPPIFKANLLRDEQNIFPVLVKFQIIII